MTRELFDRNLRRLRRERAARQGMEMFLLQRAFDDCLERVGAIDRPFTRALLIGSPSPVWRNSLARFAKQVETFDPSPAFCDLAADEDRHDFGIAAFDLVVAIGTLDTVNDLPLALQLIRRSLKPDAPLVGAMVGGDSLPTLRACLMEADRADGQVVGRVHPRVDGPTLTQLLTAAGFTAPVVDIDRVRLRYRSIADLVRDLRGMGATNVLRGNRPALSRARWHAVSKAFEAMQEGDRTEERIDILHFLGWSAAEG